MMMKTKMALVACALLVSSLVVADNSYSPDACCFSFYPRSLNQSRVVEFKHTDVQCAVQGVVFTTVRGKKLCVDPNVQWVKDVIEAKERELEK